MSEEFPIIDFSDIPGCESPSSDLNSRKKCTAISTRTKSRISSIFSSASTAAYDSDDDPFDLKSCSRKSAITSGSGCAKTSNKNLVKTEQLISLENSPGFDWHRLKLEAQVLASELDEEPLEMDLIKNLNLDSDDEEPRKRLFDKENLVPKTSTVQVDIDQQLEKAIRKPLTSLNPMTPSKLPMRSLMTPSKMPMKTPSKLPLKPMMTPSKIQMKSMMTPTPKLPLKPTLSTPLTSSKITPGSSRLPMTPASRRSLIKPNFITPIREERATPALSSRRAMTSTKPPASTSSTMKSNLTSTRRSIMTPVPPIKTKEPAGIGPLKPNKPLSMPSKTSLSRRRSVQVPLPTPGSSSRTSMKSFQR